MTISRTPSGILPNISWRRAAAVLVGCIAGGVLSLGPGQVRHALKVSPPAPALVVAATSASRCKQPVADLGATHPLPLSKIRYFAYQIQGLTRSSAVDALVSSRYDMMVVDPTRTDWADTAVDFDTRGMVARLKSSKASDGTHRKLVIAYVDVGEAENWRWYWTWPDKWENAGPRPEMLPTFILGHDPDGWGGELPRRLLGSALEGYRHLWQTLGPPPIPGAEAGFRQRARRGHQGRV